MTYIPLESFKDVGGSLLKGSPSQVQGKQSEEFDDVFAEVVSKIDQEGRNLEIPIDFADLFNKGLNILPDISLEQTSNNDQEDEACVIAEVQLVPDMIQMAMQQQAEAFPLVVPFVEGSDVQRESDLDTNDAASFDFDQSENITEVSLSVPLKQDDNLQTAISQYIDKNVDSSLNLQQTMHAKETKDVATFTEYYNSEVLKADASMNDLALHSKVPAGSELSDMIDQKVVNSDLQTEFTTINIPASDLEHERNGGHSIAEVEHALQGLNPTDWSVKISNLQQAPMIKPMKSEESDVAAQQVGTVEAPMLDSTLEASELKKPDETQPKMEASSSFEHGLEGGNRVSDSVRFDQLNKDQEAIEDEASLEPEVSIKTNTSGTVGLTSTNVGETHPKESGDGFVIDPKQQIARSVLEVKDTLLPKDVKTLTLSLNPEALGQVNIELVSDESGKVHVNLAVLKAETFETLQQDFSQLKTILNEIGIEDGNVSLQLSSGGEDHRHQQNAEYVAWEDRESMLVRPSEAASIPVEKMPTYPERKSHKRLDIRA